MYEKSVCSYSVRGYDVDIRWMQYLLHGFTRGAAIVDGEHIDLDIEWSAGFTANEVDVFPYPYPKESYEEDSRLLWGLFTKNGKNKYVLSMDGYEQYNKLFPEYETIPMTKYYESEIEWVDG